MRIDLNAKHIGPTIGDQRYVSAFAWLPIVTKNSMFVWLEKVVVFQEFNYHYFTVACDATVRSRLKWVTKEYFLPEEVENEKAQ
jgi:hypothetical protein